MEYTQELDELFKGLGFINFKEFIKTATPYTSQDSHESLSKNAILLDDLYSDSDEIGYIFIVDKNEETGKWHIHAINAAVQLDTVRNIEGVVVVGKEYRCDTVIPTKEEIRKEVMQMVRAKEVEEQFFIQQQKGQNWFSSGLKR